MCISQKPARLLRLPEVLDRVAMGKSKWLAGVASGDFPQPVRLGRRWTAWLESDIENFILGLLPQPLTA